MENFWGNDPVLDSDLQRVRELIKDSVDKSHGFIRPLLVSHVGSGGKMLRPALVLIAARLGKETAKDSVLRTASIIEMVHLASLIHDDILDMAMTRRGLPTLYARIGAKQAVLAGDYLLSRAISLVSDRSGDLQAATVAAAFSRLCESELDQDAGQNDFFITKSTYMRRIGGKTAALFALSCHAGAAAAEASKPDQALMHRFGYLFGMSFQIQDDMLDYIGNANDLGKQTGRDLQCGIPTLPLILALERERNVDGKRPLAALLMDKSGRLNSKDTAKAVAKVIELGGIEASAAVCNAYRDRALHNLECLSDSRVAGQLRELFIRLSNRPS
jgi:heptaprenyl diphosphate synthase